MSADADTTAAIHALIDQAYAAMSTPDSDFAKVFGHQDITVAGSGQGELLYGPDQVISVARMIASHGMAWVPEQVKVWARGDIAWAQDPGKRRGRRGWERRTGSVLVHRRLRP